MEQLADNGAHAAEMNRAGFAAQSLGQMIHVNIGAEIRCIHFLCFRMEDQIGAGRFTQCCVAVNVARIGCQVFRRAELNRIDKIRDNRAVILCDRARNQALMTFMQIAHGRYQSDRQTLCTPCLDLCAHFFYGFYDSHLYSLPFCS